MTGRSTWRAISRMTASGKVSGSPDVPTSAVGRSACTTAARSRGRPGPRPARSASAGGQASSRLYSSRIEPSSTTSPRLSRQATARIRSSPATPSSASVPRMSRADADARRARAQDHHALLAPAGCRIRCAPGDERRHRHRGGALDVVVERRQDVAIALEQRERVALLEVLPLEEGLREAAPDGVHELLDQLVVVGAAQPGMPPPEVELVVEQGLVVGADVEADRQRLAGVDAGGRGVERELADGDAHAAGALVAQPEDALVVGDDDQAHVVVRDVGQHRLDAPAVVGRDPEAAGAPEDVAVLAGRPRRRSACRRWAAAPRGDRAARGRRGARCDPAAPPARCSARADRCLRTMLA